MEFSVVPQANATRGGTLFELPEEYDPLLPSGVDRAFFHYLKENFEAEGHEVGTVDQIGVEAADIVLFIGFRDNFDSYYRAVKQDRRPYIAFLAREPPVYTPQHAEKTLTKLTRHFDLVFTWNDALEDVAGIRTYNWPVSPRQLSTKPLSNSAPFKDRKLITNVSTHTASGHSEELYSERRRVVEFYEANHPKSFSLFGRGWDEHTTLAHICKGLWKAPDYEVYQGAISSKTEAYAQHRFALAFENMTGINGWISEKVFDVFAAGCVPVYWGASNIMEYLPEETFVDYREFGHPDELHDHLDSMSEKAYERHLNAIEQFLNDELPFFRADEVADSVANELFDMIGGPAPSPIEDISFVQELEDEYASNNVTLGRLAGQSAEAFVDPPNGLSRIGVLSTVIHAGMHHFR